MQPIIIEGTWEEIERRKAELIGQRLRVMILPKMSTKPTAKTPSKKAPTTEVPRKLTAYGMLAGVLSVDEFIRDKQEEIDLEDRNSR